MKKTQPAKLISVLDNDLRLEPNCCREQKLSDAGNWGGAKTGEQATASRQAKGRPSRSVGGKEKRYAPMERGEGVTNDGSRITIRNKELGSKTSAERSSLGSQGNRSKPSGRGRTPIFGVGACRGRRALRIKTSHKSEVCWRKKKIGPLISGSEGKARGIHRAVSMKGERGSTEKLGRR